MLSVNNINEGEKNPILSRLKSKINISIYN